MRQHICRILVAAAGTFLALRLSWIGCGLLAEAQRTESLLSALSRTEAEITALTQAKTMTDQEVRQWALSQGLSSPEDVIFFDGGTWCSGDGMPSQK